MVDGVAVVTGAGRGVGRSIAVRLAQRGFTVVAVARTEGDVAQTCARIEAAGGRGHAFPADITDPEAVEALAVRARAVGPPAVLVNAAGTFGPVAPVVAVDPAAWIRTLHVNLVGAFLTCRALVPDLVERGWGRVLNASTAATLHPPGPLNSAYATSKAALNQFTRHLAAELAGSGVTANVFHPGDVKTEMWADIRAQLATLGADASPNYQSWVAWVEETGGDPPEKAAALVERVVAGDGSVNGAFLWIDDPLQPPQPSWPAAGVGEPHWLRGEQA